MRIVPFPHYISSNSASSFILYCLICFLVLHEATLGSNDEGVCRAARGALWVIKSTTGKSPVKRSGKSKPYGLTDSSAGPLSLHLFLSDCRPHLKSLNRLVTVM